jgi:hypothetical protein
MTTATTPRAKHQQLIEELEQYGKRYLEALREVEQVKQKRAEARLSIVR